MSLMMLVMLSTFGTAVLIAAFAMGFIAFSDWRSAVNYDDDRLRLNVAMVRLWQRLNWWRYEPSEGWQLHYNTNHIPMALHLHVAQHGRVCPPTHAEIMADIHQWRLLSGLRVRTPQGRIYQLH